MPVTNSVGPLMVSMDRFLIGAVVSMTAVADYATPYEVVTKLWIISGALMGVMFPAFAAALAHDRVRTVRLFNRTVSYIFLSLFPLVLIIITLAYEGLNLWLGSEFAENSALILQLLVVGVFINSFAHVPFGMVQSAGRPDLTAKLHLAELPFYLLVLWWLVGEYGIIGAGIAWVLRAAVDCIILFIMAHRLLPSLSPFSVRPVFIAGIALSMLVLGAVMHGLVLKGLFLLLVMIIFTVVAWFVIFATEERDIIRDRLKAIPVFN